MAKCPYVGGSVALVGVVLAGCGGGGPPKPATLLTTDPAETLWVNRMPGPGPRPPQSMALTLEARWPYRSIWTRVCPTTQEFDLWIDDGNEVIWRWSEGMAFMEVLTGVSIAGPGSRTYEETWTFDPMEIEHEGTYMAHALFVATGEETAVSIEVRFVH